MKFKNQFEISIRILRSDNGREYLSHSFKNFMAFHGILHVLIHFNKWGS